MLSMAGMMAVTSSIQKFYFVRYVFQKIHMQRKCRHVGKKACEAPWKIGQVELGQVALKVACEKIRKALPDTVREILRSLGVKAVKDSVGPSRVSPMFVIFGTAARHFPALHNVHAGTHADRVRAPEAARRTVEQYGFSKHQVCRCFLQ
jgi:hypothetical protein